MKRFLCLLVLFASALLTVSAQGTSLSTPLEGIARVPGALIGLSAEGALLTSADGGVTFSQLRAADSPRALYGLAASGATVLAFGDAGYFVRSANSGSSFSAIASLQVPAFSGALRAAASNASGIWVAVGQAANRAAIFRSADDGVTWLAATLPTLPVGAFLAGVTYDALTNRWIAVGGDGVSGLVLASTDAGSSWSKITLTTDYPLLSVASDGTGNLLAVGEAGQILSSANGGVTFVSVGNDLVSENLLAVTPIGAGQWIVSGDTGVLLAYDFSLGVNGASIVAGPTPAAGSIRAVISSSTAGQYLYSAALPETSTANSKLSLTISRIADQMQLTLAGASNSSSYHMETSSNLSVWSPVPGSTQTYSGATPLTWLYPLPLSGERVFYRVRLGSTL